MAERLDAFLAHRGFGSRSQVRDLVRRGAVTIDGVVCRDNTMHLHGETISVHGDVVERGVEAATLIVHKPLGLSCSHDPAEAPLLEDLYPESLAHLNLESAGRLDRDTSGLIIVSSDGELIHSLTNPRRQVFKRYRIAYTGKLSHHAIARAAKGIRLPDDPRPTLPARLEILGPGADGLGHATLHLAEGRYHQVRRMIAALGGAVVALHRDRIGALDLPADLAAGACRDLSDPERELLFSDPADVDALAAAEAESAAEPEPPPPPAAPAAPETPRVERHLSRRMRLKMGADSRPPAG
jgi:16S rRNA pseudouridine516 synthase